MPTTWGAPKAPPLSLCPPRGSAAPAEGHPARPQTPRSKPHVDLTVAPARRGPHEPVRGGARAQDRPRPAPQPQGPGTQEHPEPSQLRLALFSVAWGPQKSISAVSKPAPGPTCTGGCRPRPARGEAPHCHNRAEARTRPVERGRGFASPGELRILAWGRSRQGGGVL